jgi:predicted nucleic acid-binding protein
VPVFIDTSGFLAFLNQRDENHPAAVAGLTRLLNGEDTLLTTNYILLETSALLARRLGLEALRDFESQLRPVLEVAWVDANLHDVAVGAQLTANRRDLSLVDCVSFEVMRQRNVGVAVAFDAHFQEQGFQTLGSSSS